MSIALKLIQLLVLKNKSWSPDSVKALFRRHDWVDLCRFVLIPFQSLATGVDDHLPP